MEFIDNFYSSLQPISMKVSALHTENIVVNSLFSSNMLSACILSPQEYLLFIVASLLVKLARNSRTRPFGGAIGSTLGMLVFSSKNRLSAIMLSA